MFVKFFRTRRNFLTFVSVHIIKKLVIFLNQVLQLIVKYALMKS